MDRMLAAIPFIVLLASTAIAHSWYPAECCTGDEMYGDCHPVPCESITEQADGLRWRDVIFPRSATRLSRDQYCHVCVQLWDDGSPPRPRCIFQPPPS
jgi:hypothetical protein